MVSSMIHIDGALFMPAQDANEAAARMVKDLERFLSAALVAGQNPDGKRWPMRYNRPAATGSQAASKRN
jgi:hypothetical protein